MLKRSLLKQKTTAKKEVSVLHVLSSRCSLSSTSMQLVLTVSAFVLICCLLPTDEVSVCLTLKGKHRMSSLKVTYVVSECLDGYG